MEIHTHEFKVGQHSVHFFFRVHQLGSRHRVGRQFGLTSLGLCLASSLEREEGKGVNDVGEGMSVMMRCSAIDRTEKMRGSNEEWEKWQGQWIAENSRSKSCCRG